MPRMLKASTRKVRATGFFMNRLYRGQELISPVNDITGDNSATRSVPSGKSSLRNNFRIADHPGTLEGVLFRRNVLTKSQVSPYGLIARARATSTLFQSSRGSAAARANVHRRTRSCSTPRRSESLPIAFSGSDCSLPRQLNRCWVAS